MQRYMSRSAKQHAASTRNLAIARLQRSMWDCENMLKDTVLTDLERACLENAAVNLRLIKDTIRECNSYFGIKNREKKSDTTT